MIEVYISKRGYQNKSDIDFGEERFQYRYIMKDTLEASRDILKLSLNGYVILPGLFDYEQYPNGLFTNKWHNSSTGSFLANDLDNTFRLKANWRGGQLFYLDIDKVSIDPRIFINNLIYKPTGGYTTYSNDPGNNKFCYRLLYVFDRVLNRDEWTGASRFLFDQALLDNKQLLESQTGKGKLDRACLVGVQSMNGTYGEDNIICYDGPIYNFEQLGCQPIECNREEKTFDVRSWLSNVAPDFFNALFPVSRGVRSDGTTEEINLVCTGKMLQLKFGRDLLEEQGKRKLRRYFHNYLNTENIDKNFDYIYNGQEIVGMQTYWYEWRGREGETHFYQPVNKDTFRKLFTPFHGYTDPNNSRVVSKKCQPGWGRKKQILEWTMQMVRMIPTIWADELIYNLIWLIDEHINRGSGNNAITSNTVIDIVDFVFNLEWDEIVYRTREWDKRNIYLNDRDNRQFVLKDYYYSGDKKYNYSASEEGKDIRRLAIEGIKRDIFNQERRERFEKMNEYVQSNCSGDVNMVNVSQMSQELEIPVRTIYKDLKSSGIDLKTEERRKLAYEHNKNPRIRRNKLTDEEFLELYDPELTNEENIEKINAWGDKKILKIKISRATFFRYKNRLF